MSRLARLLDDALEDLHRVELVLADRLASMRESSTAWPAGSGATTGGGRLVHWCWEHEREVDVCHREGDACDGEPMDAGHDPTGEAAANADRGFRDHQAVERRLKSIRRMADELVSLMVRYDRRPPTAEERRSTLGALERNERAEECWSHARTVDGSGNPRFAPGFRRVVVDGDKRTVCRWCHDWLRDVGGLPSPKQVDEFERVGRVRRPEPKAS